MENQIESEKTRKVRLKSGRMFPRRNLEEAISFIREVSHKCGTNNINMDVLKSAMGVIKRSEVFEKNFTSAKQYNLLEINKDNRVNLTALAKEILFPTSEQHARKAIHECFKAPSLFEEIIDNFKGTILPPTLPNILFKDYGIENAYKDDAFNNFYSSGKFAGLIDKENRLHSEISLEEKTDEPVIEKKENAPVTIETPQIVETRTYKEEESESDGQKFKLKFSNGKYAKLFIPNGFTERDLKKLISQIDVLKYDLEDKEELTLDL